MNEFLHRLKERKLVQWAIGYVAAAFALLQGIDIVTQRFDWPEIMERALIITACIGFFLALILAWYHGERGSQRVSGTELLIIALVLALGAGSLWRFAAELKRALELDPLSLIINSNLGIAYYRAGPPRRSGRAASKDSRNA